MRSGFVEQNSTSHISSCSAREVKLRYTSLAEAYRSGHNKAVLKICEHIGRKNVKKPCKHWLFGHSESNRKQHF